MAAFTTGLLLIQVLLAAGCLASDYGQDVLDRLVALEKTNLQQQMEIRQLNARLNDQETESRNRRDLPSNGEIAFTSYLSHDVDSIQIHDTIIFDSELLNEGAAYDNATGAFTAPVSGVYFFTYFVGQADAKQINTMLTVNKKNYVDAIAEGIEADHNDQSGNAATMKLSAGDKVRVLHRKVGDHIEGAPGLRLSTFSGFLLYAVDDDVSIIG